MDENGANPAPGRNSQHDDSASQAGAELLAALDDVAPQGDDPEGDRIELKPFYYDLKNEIVKPQNVVVGTRYFWDKWAPRMGPTLTVLIVRLRMHCYFNQRTQERRDWCFPTQETLATEIGVSRWTVMRELRTPWAKKFVRVQYRSRYDPERQRTVRTSSLYHVAMDDPLVPEDEAQLAAAAAEYQARFPACGGKPGKVANDNLSREVASCTVNAASAQPSAATATATAPARKRPKPEDHPLFQELLREKLSMTEARRLLRSYPAEHVEQQLARFRRLEQAAQLPGRRNMAPVLVRFIEQTPPATAKGPANGATHPGAKGAVPPVAKKSTAPAPEAHAVAPSLWERAATQLRERIGEAAFRRWFGSATVRELAGGGLSLTIGRETERAFVEERYGLQLRRIVASLTGSDLPVEFESPLEAILAG